MQMYRLETMSSYNEKAPPLFLEVGIDRFGDGKPYYFKTNLSRIYVTTEYKQNLIPDFSDSENWAERRMDRFLSLGFEPLSEGTDPHLGLDENGIFREQEYSWYHFGLGDYLTVGFSLAFFEWLGTPYVVSECVEVEVPHEFAPVPEGESKIWIGGEL